MRKILFVLFAFLVNDGFNSPVSPDLSSGTNHDWYYSDTLRHRMPDSLFIRN